jgi:hypothetical protein
VWRVGVVSSVHMVTLDGGVFLGAGSGSASSSLSSLSAVCALAAAAEATGDGMPIPRPAPDSLAMRFKMDALDGAGAGGPVMRCDGRCENVQCSVMDGVRKCNAVRWTVRECAMKCDRWYENAV